MMNDNEKKLEQFADLLEPFAEILADEEVSKRLQKGGKPIKAIAYAIKNHKAEVISILATMDGVSPDEYKFNGFVVTKKLFGLLNNPEIQELFTSQGQNDAAGSFGSVTENIEDGVK